MKNQKGIAILAVIFIGAFFALAGWTIGRIVKIHKADDQLIVTPAQ